MSSSKNGKTRTISLVLMSRQEKPADLSLELPGQLKTRPKAFHSYCFIKVSRKPRLRTF